MKSAPDFHPSDIFYRLNDLERLMQAIHDILHDMDYARQDGSRIDELDTVASLHRIAHRDAAEIRDMASIFDGPVSWQSDSCANPELQRRIYTFKSARAAYQVREEADTDTAGTSPEWDAYEVAEDALLSFPCKSMADVALKADLIISDNGLSDTIRNCFKIEGDGKKWRLEPFLRSMKGEAP